MNVLVTIDHDLSEESDQTANYSIKQVENDDGVVKHDVENSGDFKDFNSEEWFNGMAQIVKNKMRSEVFNTILEDSNIKDGLFKLSN